MNLCTFQSPLILIWISFTFIFLQTPNVHAKTSMIHVSSDELHKDPILKRESIAFRQLCSKSGINSPEDCLIFPDDSILNRNSKKLILDQIILKLQESLPGDQLAFSFIGHGNSQMFSGSQLWINEKQSISKSELGNLLKQYRKPGVRVFVNFEACFSGSISELSYGTKGEVCTFSMSSPYRIGEARRFNTFWQRVAALKQPQEELSLGYVRDSGHLFSFRVQGGGFSSEVIRSKLTEKSGLGDQIVSPRVREELRSKTLGTELAVTTLRNVLTYCGTEKDPSANEDSCTDAIISLYGVSRLGETRFVSNSILFKDLQSTYCRESGLTPISSQYTKICRAIWTLQKLNLENEPLLERFSKLSSILSEAQERRKAQASSPEETSGRFVEEILEIFPGLSRAHAAAVALWNELGLNCQLADFSGGLTDFLLSRKAWYGTVRGYFEPKPLPSDFDEARRCEDFFFF